MANRNALLGRSKPSEKLTKDEISALDKVTVPPVPPAKPPGKKGGGPQRMVRSGWSARICCSFAGASSALVAASRSPAKASPSPGKGSPGAAAAKWSWSWAAGDAAGNPEYVNQEALMIEPEVLKELRIIVAKVAHADQASGRAPAHVLQAKEKVREELVSAVREKYEAYLATAN